jgi:hypothetical protein
VVLGLRGGVAGQNPARPAAGPAGKGLRRGLGTVGNQFMCLLAAERWPEGMGHGVRRRPPRERLLRRAGSRAWATSVLGSSGGS